MLSSEKPVIGVISCNRLVEGEDAYIVKTRYVDAVARYAMSDEELQQIQQAALPEVAFTRLWTMKESLLKLTGEGINDMMKKTLENSNIEWFTTVERLDKKYIYTVCEQ